jgi:hypothetical protein
MTMISDPTAANRRPSSNPKNSTPKSVTNETRNSPRDEKRNWRRSSNRTTARNFNPVMAKAADTTIVTANNIVPVGLIAPDHVVTPAPLIDYLVTNG